MSKQTSVSVVGSPIAARLYHREHTIAQQRREGRMRDIVVRQIRAGIDPIKTDLAIALCETPPDPTQIARVEFTDKENDLFFRKPPSDPAAWMRKHIRASRRKEAIEKARQQIASDTQTLCEYVANAYVLRKARRKDGRKRKDRPVTAAVSLALAFAKVDRENQHRRTPKDEGVLKSEFARQHGVSVRDLYRAIAAFPAKND